MQRRGIGVADKGAALARPAADEAFDDARVWLGSGGPSGGTSWIPAIDHRDSLPPEAPSRLRETGTQEFIHSLSRILGRICRAGFVIEDVHEPDHAEPKAAVGTFGHRAAFVPPYIRVLARRTGNRAVVTL